MIAAILQDADAIEASDAVEGFDAVMAADAVEGFAAWRPALIVAVAVVALVMLVRFILHRRDPDGTSETTRFRVQAWTAGIIFAGFIVLIFVLPDGVDRNLALSAIGLVVTGALAISSQSIIANGMAGIMLRIIKNFRPGDFIEVGENRGRVSEMGLFHTEIQSPDRDLITLPNALMVTEPVRVMRSSGTIVSVTIGLGYDLSRHRLKELFIEAAERAELADPFVQVIELGDYAVTYRVAGFLGDSTRILATRSRLREALLDTLSEAKIEIMSPMYVSRRSVSEDPLIPAWTRPKASVENRPTAEDKVFDKAELAASGTAVREEAETTRASIEQLEALADTQEGVESEKTRSMIEVEQEKLDRLTAQLKELDGAQSLQE